MSFSVFSVCFLLALIFLTYPEKCQLSKNNWDKPIVKEWSLMDPNCIIALLRHLQCNINML